MTWFLTAALALQQQDVEKWIADLRIFTASGRQSASASSPLRSRERAE